MITISNQSARRLILHLQGLSAAPNQRLAGDQLCDLIGQLGFVQVDSIRWVERAQHMILFSRSEHYRPEHLKHELEERKTLFENYTHDASVIPAELFRYWRHRFARDRDRLKERLVRWQGDGFIDHCARLQRRVRDRGSIRSRDVKPKGKKSPTETWQWHDGKAALEFLWRTGKLGIEARDGFEKVYNLAGRVVSAEDYAARCTRAEFVHWSCETAIERLGFGSAKDIAGFWNHVSIAEVNRWLKRQRDGAVREVAVINQDGSSTTGLFGRADLETLIAEVPKPPTRVRVLSPFDPVIRDRDRLERLFGFRYRIEIYVPEAKREYGYYVFPLLESDRLIGRVDMRADRATETLEVKRVWMEAGCEMSPARKKRLDQELQRVARFTGMQQVRWA